MKWPWVSRKRYDSLDAVAVRELERNLAANIRIEDLVVAHAELQASTRPLGYVVVQRDTGPEDKPSWFLHWEHTVYASADEAVLVADRSAVEFGQPWRVLALTDPSRSLT